MSRGRFFLIGVGILCIVVVRFVVSWFSTQEFVIMSDAIQSLIRRLETTLKRQEQGISETRAQLEAARALIAPAGKK